MINEAKFFDGYKQKFGRYNNAQYSGMLYLLDKFSNSELFDRVSKIAYAFATIRTETAYSYEPVREGYYLNKGYMETMRILYNYYLRNNRGAIKTIFPFGLDAINYVGRGYIQNTHNYNAIKHRQHVLDNYGIDIVKDPEKMLDRDISFDIMEKGMNIRNLSFTGKVLDDYFNDNTANYSLVKRFIGYRNLVYYLVTPRRIINGTDKYADIGNDAIKFYDIIYLD